MVLPPLTTLTTQETALLVLICLNRQINTVLYLFTWQINILLSLLARFTRQKTCAIPSGQASCANEYSAIPLGQVYQANACSIISRQICMHTVISLLAAFTRKKKCCVLSLPAKLYQRNKSYCSYYQIKYRKIVSWPSTVST